MANWTVKEVTNWLKENGFKKQTKLFKERNIDGHALLRLTDQDISQLLSSVNEDGTIQEPIIGVKSRFRMVLKKWKMDHNNNSRTVALTNVIESVESTKVGTKTIVQEAVVPEKPMEKESDQVKCKEIYSIDKEIEVQFFNNQKFLSYFINYIKQETSSIDIKIRKVDPSDGELSIKYAVKLNGTKQQNRVARKFIKHLLESIKFKKYHQKDIQNWTYKSKPIKIIQNIFDHETNLFTVCKLHYRTLEIDLLRKRRKRTYLEIYYFEDEKFNPSDYQIKIDHIIQNQINQENLVWKSVGNRNTVEFIPFNTHESSWEYQICETEEFSKELEEVLNQYKQENLLVCVIENTQQRSSLDTTLREIQILGEKKLVNEGLTKFKDLFSKHQLRKFRFSQLSSAELDCLASLCSKELRMIENEFRNSSVHLPITENYFYSPQCLKTEVQNRVKSLLSNIKIKKLPSIDFYFNTADQLSLKIKNLAQRNRCYCDINLQTESKSYPIPRGHGSISNTSKSIIEQSNLFCSSSFVSSQTKLANSSLEVLIGDIASQKVDILIIPSTSFGLKENLIERAGEIIEKATVPFLTETTGGRLSCQKILFLNWSLPTTVVNDDDLSGSVRLFLSKSMEYVLKEIQISKSIAFAMPDSCKQEEIFAEEIIEEMIHQINSFQSISLKILFVLLPDQQTLHQRILNKIEKIRQGEKSFGSFSCPTSTVTISLMSFDEEYLIECERKIQNYLKRSICKTKLDGFEHWNQHLINAFYQYAIDRCVLPKTDTRISGPTCNMYEVNQKYQLTNALIQQKRNFPLEFSTNRIPTGYNIMLSYSREDSLISHRLATRLTEEGFAVWINSAQSIEFEKISKKISKSDCVILCISKNYDQNQFCEKEAKYAGQRGKYIIPVKMEYYQPIEWLQKLIEKESYFQLFGSDHHFNFEYEKLLLKILQYTKPDYISSPGQTSHVLQQTDTITSFQNNIDLYFLLTPEQKKLRHEKNIKKIIKSNKGRIKKEDRQDLLDKSQDMIQMKENQCQKYLTTNQYNGYSYRNRYFSCSDNPDHQQKQAEFVQMIKLNSGIVSYKQWLDKLGNLKTIMNIAPFTFTGDINDAIFPLLNEVFQNSYLLYSLRKHYSITTESDSSSKESDTLAIYHSTKVKKQFRSTKKRSSFVSRLGNNSVRRSKKVDEYKEVKKSRKIIPKKPPRNARYSRDEKLQFQSKFAEQMQKNIDEFEKFYEDYDHSSSPVKKRKIHVYSTAIFGPNPFSEITVEPRKRLETRKIKELPLKFPWNGVFDTTTPTVKWQDPSVFFFIEIKSSQKH